MNAYRREKLQSHYAGQLRQKVTTATERKINGRRRTFFDEIRHHFALFYVISQRKNKTHMLTQEERQAIIELIHRQVVPAIGCTEPIAVALCVAKARETLGAVPESIRVDLSANILKNAMGVGIPGTGMTGLPIAIALGALIGRAELGLEVLQDCNRAAVDEGKKYIAEGRISIKLKDDAPDKLYIAVTCTAGGHEAEARIATEHTNFVYLRKDGDVRLDKPVETVETAHEEDVELTLRKVYDFATETDVDELRFILDAKKMNEAAAADGLRENYGHQLGKTLCSPLGRGIMGEGIFSKVLSATSCACDARMAGAMIPVMSNSGSGNQGICATMPVVVFAEENHNTEEETIRALILRHDIPHGRQLRADVVRRQEHDCQPHRNDLRRRETELRPEADVGRKHRHPQRDARHAEQARNIG